MNAFRTALPTSRNPTASQPAQIVTLPIRHLHRERDFGVGYGNSSGYAAPRRYADNAALPRFRCA